MLSTSMTRTLGVAIFSAFAAAATAVFAAGTDDGHSHGHGAAEHPAMSKAERLHQGAALIDARQLYLDNCGTCHGPRGKGTDAAATDFSDPEALVGLTREVIEAALADGHDARLDKPLAAADRDTIIDYLRSYLMLPAPDADTDIGRAVYARTCSVCHGDRGDASSWAKNSLYPPPADFTAHGLEALSRDKMIDSVTFGSKNSAMMPFAVQLSHEEIAATVDYIRAAFMPEGMGTIGDRHDHGHAQGHEHGADEGGDAPFPAGLAGDPVWGKTFYEANCAECHGEKGDGEGRRAYFMIKKPKDFLSREARAELARPKLFEHISKGVTGTTMPAWGKVLSPQEIANVGEYVYRAFLNPDRFAATEAPGAPAWKPAGTEHSGSGHGGTDHGGTDHGAADHGAAGHGGAGHEGTGHEGMGHGDTKKN